MEMWNALRAAELVAVKTMQEASASDRRIGSRAGSEPVERSDAASRNPEHNATEASWQHTHTASHRRRGVSWQ